MSAGTSEFFCLICLLLCSCTAQTIITVKRGQDVILPCKVPNINNINDITAIGWSRPGLDPEHVLLYRDGRFDSRNQHESYQNRVDLQDKEMKDGDASLILKNVTMEDTGRYVCHVSQKGNNEPFSIINLEVLPPALEITAELGQDVILPCKVPNINIKAVKWIRPDLDPEHVLVYRNERFDHQSQHESYQNRVDLQDKEMKDGDVSLILKNVKMEDTGTYKCFASQERKTKLISIINLEVLLSDHSWKTKVIVGVVVTLGVFILLIPAVLCCWKRKKEMQEVIQQLMGIHSETIIQLHQEKQKNETLKNEQEKLERSNSENSNLLQQEKQRNEKAESEKKILKNRLEELERSYSETNKQLRWEVEFLKNELRRYKLENQKLKKTVGHLDTDHQNMNQKLELTGPMPVQVFY